MSEKVIEVESSNDIQKLDLSKFSPKQIFSYNCTNCGKHYEKKLYRLQQFNFELLCNGCSRMKNAKPLTEEQKKTSAEKRKQTWLKKYGVENALQSKETREKIKQTNLSRYGVGKPFQSENVQEKIKQTNLSKYGVENPLQSEEIQERIKRTNLSKYAVENPLQSEEIQEKIKQTNLAKYGVEYASQAESVREKIKQTNLEKYGVEHPWQNKEIREKIKQTSFEKYGVEYPWQSEGIRKKIKEKIKQTCLERYGVEHNWQIEEVKEKIRQTNLRKYGAEYFTQSKEMHKFHKAKYVFESRCFDSKPELAFYIYCKDHGVEIERNVQKFKYEVNGKKHVYFPDFVVDGELVEIKGDHFLVENKNYNWQNPYDHSQDPQYAAKSECAKVHNIKVIRSSECQDYINFVIEKYGKDFFQEHQLRDSQETSSREPIILKDVEDMKNLDLSKLSPKQIFSYACTNCGKYYERSLQRLQQFNFELLCKSCTKIKHATALTDEQKKVVAEKRKQTCLERYGAESPLQSEEIQEKIKQTNLSRYGVEHVSQSEEIKEKIKQTNLSKYGVESPWQSQKVREKIKQTNLSKYGVENPWQSQKVREKIRQTSLERYGVEHPMQSVEIQEKMKQTNLRKYGVENFAHSKEMHKFHKARYVYENEYFDSKPELAFYIYCKDHNVSIERNAQELLYESQGKVHRYFPDFVVEGELVEIKGGHFLDEVTDTWQNPFDHSQDVQYEAKHQCALKNNVRILYSRDCENYINFVNEKYSKGFFESCRTL